MAVALLLLVALLIVGRSELGIKGIALSIAAFLGITGAIIAFGAPSALVAAVAAVLDIGLILFIFGGDIPLRPRT